MLSDWKIQLTDRPGFDGRRVYIYRKTQTGTQFLTGEGNLIEIASGAANLKDDDIYFAELNTEQITALANTLSEQGFKTTGGSIEAQNLHLEDMRRLVFERRIK